MAVIDLINKNKMWSAVSVIIFISYFASPGECRPWPTYRWFDYENFPSESQAKPILDTGTGHILETVGPLRPYEPWILDCNLLFTEKRPEAPKRHPRCKEVDETNETEYAKFLLHVQQWEEAYTDRAERWNTRFPDARENEKKKYEQLKAFADSHNL